MTNGTISEKCEELYNKLNSFVTSVINRDVTPKLSNLNTEVWGSNTQTGNSRIDALETVTTSLGSDVTSLSTSITNLVKIQYIESGAKSINNGTNITVTHTVTACPSGYSWLWVQRDSYRVTQTDVNLNNRTFSYKLHNYTGNNSTACYVRGWLVFYPSTWNI